MITEDPVPRRRVGPKRLRLPRPGALWPGRPRWTAPASTRRGVLRGLFTLTVVSFTGGTLARINAAPRTGADPTEPWTGTGEAGSPWLGTGEAAAAGTGLPTAFDETYRGRRIQGRTVLADMHAQAMAAAAGRAPERPPGTVPALPHPGPGGSSTAGAGFEALIDGRHLHLMRRADGTYISSVDHYTSYATPLEAVRAAVDVLGPARLAANPVHGK
ncbi:tyrosinase cofactor [Streptomyces sp. TLI_146]|uniref:tyrosinase cofactor n=1 Tax=Streptomyces sp. TLI_146 TaxID=1938858 RepID=UPI000CC9938B|nr:tyrosinase cofactor [Streptomyces sp. TLI_146]PKV77007.1 tyrosinase co-factor MelC1 [Streptomyces sp. TLI_146]